MIENINITVYLILVIILYAFLLLFAVVNINNSEGEYFIRIKTRIKSVFTSNPKTKNLFVALKNRVYLPLLIIFKFFFGYLLLLSEYIYKIDLFIIQNSKVIFGEPVDYTSLALRKLYGENIQTVLLYSTAAIVVFYFILSIF